MITHYFKLARKTLQKNRYYTLINVFGLVCGTLTALIIANYIGSSLKQDGFHEHKDKIFAITQAESVNNNPDKESNSTYWGTGEMLLQYPEVKHVTRASFHVGSLIKAEDGNGKSISFLEKRIYSADSNFLKTFTFPLILGNVNTALSQSNSIVITETIAKKYFGDTNPLGRAISIRVPWGREDLYKVTGVLEDLPMHTRFNFDFLAAYAPVEASNHWNYPSFTTYAFVDKQTNTEALIEKASNALGAEPALQQANKKVKISLTSMAKPQLSDTEYLLIIVGIFILLISWLNYFNQIIAQSYARSKQIGVLKVLGASQQNLKIQFAFESMLICLGAFLLTLGIYLGIEPFLQSFTNGHLLPLITTPTLIHFIFLAIFCVGIVLSASLPIIIFSSQNFGATLRNLRWDKVGKLNLRKGLVVTQFTLSTIMVIGIFVISNQLDYLQNADKGINMEDVLVVKAPILKAGKWNEKRKALELFKEECIKLPFVEESASSTTVASEEYRNETYIGFQENEDKTLVHQNGVDDQFFNLYDITFVAGNNFVSEAKFKNRKSIILNESAARNLGITNFDEAINSKITDFESEEVYNLIGIVKDYHKTSLKYQMQPSAFRYNRANGHISLKVNLAGLDPNRLDQQIDAVKNIWERIYQDAAFNYYFLDAQYAKQDADDRNFGFLFRCFTALSIIISCLGLFSLSLFISIKRQKEIGVRKVFGASIGEILLIFYKSYVIPLLISIIIGAPLAYLLMERWLQNYAYRTSIEPKTIILALLSLSLLFFFTISYHIIKSSLANPVKILKTE